MAKELEGEHYYYSPHISNVWLYKIYQHNGSVDPIATGLDQENASLIVDALNFYTDPAGILEKKYGTKKSTN